MKKVANGFFAYRIKQKGATNEVESLRNNINNMLNKIKIKLDTINKILDEYSKGNYKYEISQSQKNEMNGEIGSLVSSSFLLGTSTSQLIAMISNAGEELNSSTGILKTSSENLSNSSNTQASSLEETAAAVEEITSNIQSNSSNVNNMANLADELTNTIKSRKRTCNKNCFFNGRD